MGRGQGPAAGEGRGVFVDDAVVCKGCGGEGGGVGELVEEVIG